jgi:hypothetical protein
MQSRARAKTAFVHSWACSVVGWAFTSTEINLKWLLNKIVANFRVYQNLKDFERSALNEWPGKDLKVTTCLRQRKRWNRCKQSSCVSINFKAHRRFSYNIILNPEDNCHFDFCILSEIFCPNLDSR